MSLRSSCHGRAIMVLTRADDLFIHNYIRSLIKLINGPDEARTHVLLFLCLKPV